jgi:hypothetical protein
MLCNVLSHHTAAIGLSDHVRDNTFLTFRGRDEDDVIQLSITMNKVDDPSLTTKEETATVARLYIDISRLNPNAGL